MATKQDNNELNKKTRQIENQQMQETFQGQKALIEHIKQEKIK